MQPVEAAHRFRSGMDETVAGGVSGADRGSERDTKAALCERDLALAILSQK
jgi:hypothetical protein